MDSNMKNELYELADREPSKQPHPVAQGGRSGVALPEVGPMGNGVIVSTAYARQLGAQLILAADETDDLVEIGREQAEKTHERIEHRRADAFAQVVLGSVEPYPNESPEEYHTRVIEVEHQFRDDHPEWKPEKFNKRSES